MNRLKILRKEKGETQDQVAEIAGVSKRSYIYWENGERQIKPDKAQALADYFGVSVGYLLGYTDDRKLYDDEIVLEPEDGIVITHSNQRYLNKVEPARKRAQVQKEKNDFINFLVENQLFLDNQAIDGVLGLIKNLELNSSDPWRIKLSEMIVNKTLPAELEQKYSYMIDKGMY
ncbi:helix-turn-helix transcriptional regulator [Streptococcus parasuis]|uniref:helix-turn-helix domain-containing protein n=1 Tax=Streptococcus parasuis TaxID=1501662 RepID=UPI001C2B8132|nr:helix-turn-helix transcriptional regulator [Streptococcus parasuis]MBV1943225.1 helix-turn-helix transcriptional regulator [Streptococcus parasuis]QXF04953.1 helix-turn-helix transcriptional regulator [Streptococcus parasuis]